MGDFWQRSIQTRANLCSRSIFQPRTSSQLPIHPKQRLRIHSIRSMMKGKMFKTKLSSQNR
jgi:hypothetical protein